MPDDRELLNEMLEQVVALEYKLGKLKSDAAQKAILERLRKLRESLSEMLKQIKPQ